MAQCFRICMAIAVLSGLTVAAYATDGMSLDERKERMVRATFGEELSSSQRVAMLERVPSANALTEILYAGEGEAPVLTFYTSWMPQCEASLSEDATVLKIQFLDTINTLDNEAFISSHTAFLRGMQATQSMTALSFSTTLVLEFALPCRLKTTTEDFGLRLELRPCDRGLSAIESLLPSELAQEGDTADPVLSIAIEAQPPASPEVNSIMGQLAALQQEEAVEIVSVEPLELSTFSVEAPVDAAEDDEIAEEAAPAEEAEVAAETEEAAPEPPGKREEPAPDTTEANADIVTRMTNLLSGLAAGADPVAAEGVTSTGAPVKKQQPVAATPSNAPPAPAPKAYVGNPLNQRVNIDFREMELANVVALLAHKAGINVIAGTDLTGVVTANLREVPLRQAMETCLRMNGLGMLEEEGIFRIVPYQEAVSSQRTTSMVTLENAKAEEVRTVLEEIIKGSPDESQVSLSSNGSANVVLVAGPEERVAALVDMAKQLDISEPVLPTVTIPIKLNYAEPTELMATVQGMLTPEIGQVAADARARHLILTDVPVVVEQIRNLITDLDIPVKQVLIESMVVDVVLTDEADTGVDWLLNSVRRQSTRDAVTGTGTAVGNLQELGLNATMPIENAAGVLNFALLSKDIDWSGVIQAEVRNRNGNLISSPVLVTVENKPATITIAQEIPYIELTETGAGGSQTNTEFKEVGTILEVTPRITHDDHIIVDLMAKESFSSGEFNGVPIEDKREVESSLRMNTGQTIFVGGLRKNDNDVSVKKIPILGDIPAVNFLFRQNTRSEQTNELMIFLTCNVINEEMPDLNPYQEEKYTEGKNAETKVDVMNNLVHDMMHPAEMRDPVWKFRRSK